MFNNLFNNRKTVCVFCGKRITKGLDRCPYCGYITSVFPNTDTDKRSGKWEMDTNHCHACQKKYKMPDDKFCRYCGAKRENRPVKYYVVSPEDMECVYGPMPVALKYVCHKCHYQWKGSNWEKESHCPQCGASVSAETLQKGDPLWDEEDDILW